MDRWASCLVLIVVGYLLGPCSTAGDFGLPYSVPGFDSSFRSGIGSGIVAVVKANASLLKYDANLDRSGATTVLFGVATNLTSPLNKLLGHVAAAFGANGTEALQKLTDELQATVSPTTSALEQASASIRSLEGTVRPNVIGTLASNVSTIATEVETLSRNWTPFSEAVKTASSPDSSYGAKSISTLITSDMVQSLTSPILLINAALVDISSAIATIAKDRTTAIGYEAATNTSVQNAHQDLSGSVTLVNRTLADTGRQMAQQTNGTVRQVREGYSSLLGRLADESHTALVRSFIEVTEAQGVEHNRRTEELLSDVAASYTRSVQASGDAIGERLFAATAALIDEATVSESGHADRCLQRYVGDFRQSSNAPTRLPSCYQADARTVNYFSSANSAFLEQLRNGAVYGSQAQSVCNQGSTNCTAVYLESLDAIGKQNQVRLDGFIAFLREESAALTARYDVCTRAIRSDIEHLVETINEKFRNCLQTGR